MAPKVFLLALVGICSFLPSIDGKQHLRTQVDFLEHDERELQTKKYCKRRIIGFDGLSAGEITSNQFPGVKISGKEQSRQGNSAMVFDSHRATGDDKDLKFVNRKKILILSSDGKADDPSSSNQGGIFTFTFDKVVQMESVMVMDVEYIERGEIRLFDSKNGQLKEFKIPAKNNKCNGGGGSGGGKGKDLGIRFSKITFDDTVKVPKDFLPLGKEDFPPRGRTDLLIRESNAHSVVTQEDFEVKRSIAKLIRTVSGLPSHASSDPKSPFWTEFAEVIQAQKDRRNKVSAPDVFPLARIWFGYDLEHVAEAVHDEFPGTNQAVFMGQLLDDPNFKIDDTIIPRRCRGAFLRKNV
eukprot:CAMPEP_0118712014 /NCGR_PEP_ID=MMETSP0800-20121206/24501_1 /TAXON_ID=210618 ORGANISM="Striatella unipunctata, Strain CCMP2910" /NCGR_SAMPLE_ID=MMETSP0800 /ASSEMBLY_ACC=CAM_ASM_000638 /LENGTH=352 /DNA_ID=CAMNT_0006616859 /DNA_START=424 /DNA_END=1479 /DNA_ORIENTATION=+